MIKIHCKQNLTILIGSHFNGLTSYAIARISEAQDSDIVISKLLKVNHNRTLLR